MKSSTKRWLEAGYILQNDPNAIITCPECNVGKLIVKDEPIDNSSTRIDRYLICDTCGKWNVITMQKPILE